MQFSADAVSRLPDGSSANIIAGLLMPVPLLLALFPPESSLGLWFSLCDNPKSQ
jgi:hypothetical protein